MHTVPARLSQPPLLVVGLLVVVALVVALGLLVWAGGAENTEQLVGPFRWRPLKGIG
jgi:hypothetical protein